MGNPERGTITSKVNDFLDRNVLVSSALDMDILNATKTAELIKKEMEMDCNIHSIISAIRRYESPELDSGENLLGLGESYSKLKTLRRDLLGRSILLSIDYFDSPVKEEAIKEMSAIISDREFSSELFDEILEKNISEDIILRRGNNGDELSINGDKKIAIKGELEEFERILNEKEFIYPPLDRPLEYKGARGVERRLDETIFVPYSLESDIYKTGLLVSSIGDNWEYQSTLMRMTEDFADVNRPDFVVSEYITNLENNKLIKSKGSWRHIKYTSTQIGESLIDGCGTLEEIIKIWS